MLLIAAHDFEFEGRGPVTGPRLSHHEAPDVRVVSHGYREAVAAVGGGEGVEGGVARRAEPRILGTILASFEMRKMT